MTTLRWLHLSDIHFLRKKEATDGRARKALLALLERKALENGRRDETLVDIVFCTGDIAFGETAADPIAEQYSRAEKFLNEVKAAVGANGAALSSDRLFVIPGNHDINGSKINALAQKALEVLRLQTISMSLDNLLASGRGLGDTLERMQDYFQFQKTMCPHIKPILPLHIYDENIVLKGVQVRVLGMNSAWTCSTQESPDSKCLHIASSHQTGEFVDRDAAAEVTIGLIHHPITWLSDEDARMLSARYLKLRVDFLLQGHLHFGWLNRGTPTTICAGAAGADNPEELSFNLVEWNLATRRLTVEFFKFDALGLAWMPKLIPDLAPHGRFAETIPELVGVRRAVDVIADEHEALLDEYHKAAGMDDLMILTDEAGKVDRTIRALLDGRTVAASAFFGIRQRVGAATKSRYPKLIALVEKCSQSHLDANQKVCATLLSDIGG